MVVMKVLVYLDKDKRNHNIKKLLYYAIFGPIISFAYYSLRDLITLIASSKIRGRVK